jgi:hypothetical protein
MHTLDIDMWLSEEGWNAGKPAVPFDKLPVYDHDAVLADEPKTYWRVAVPNAKETNQNNYGSDGSGGW